MNSEIDEKKFVFNEDVENVQWAGMARAPSEKPAPWNNQMHNRFQPTRDWSCFTCKKPFGSKEEVFQHKIEAHNWQGFKTYEDKQQAQVQGQSYGGAANQ